MWPFYEIDQRLGCMKEYSGMHLALSKTKDIAKKIHLFFTKLIVQFDTFICPLVYSSRDEKKIQKYGLTQTVEDELDIAMLRNVTIRNTDLAELKRYFERSPLQDFEEIKEKPQLFKCREHYQTHPRGLPVFLKSVQWDRPVQVNEVYNMIENWAPMEPEDAI